MDKKVLLRVLLLLVIVTLAGFLVFKLISSNSSEGDGNEIEIIQLDDDTRMKTGDYIVLTNALYQKALETSTDITQTVHQFNKGDISSTELTNGINQANKKLTYYYLVAIQNKPSSVTEELSINLNYEFYLMRRGSEELLKYTMDHSTLRLDVGLDLLSQAVSNEQETNEAMATEIVRYAINPESVVVDESVWDKEYTFLEEHPDMVIFQDIESDDKSSYSYYLKFVNESFMLVSWEIQKMYLNKIDYTNEEITREQLGTKLDGSGFIINQVYDDLGVLEAPEGLGQLEEDTHKTMTLYRDAMKEIHKFRMSGDIKHFDNAMIIVDQADVEAGRIGEFIYAIRQQYGL